MARHLDPRARREQLFRIHSALRSADNLRPDEAFDELAKLYRVWIEAHPDSIDTGLANRFGIRLSEVALDAACPPLWSLLSAADDGVGADLFQELADVGVRAGLGQYFTPAPVAKAMLEYLVPSAGEHWMDPFLGSGLLLGAVALTSVGPVHLHGVDLDQRVIHLAELEARLRHPHAPLSAAQFSALERPSAVLDVVGAPEEGVDGIVTNPPFGAVDLNNHGANGFVLAQGRRTPIEVLGLEQCLRLLKDGGRLGIVLPQSVLSNQRLQHVRRFLRERSTIDAVLSLPGEAFSMYEGVGKASVVFLTKKETSGGAVWFGRATSVGWDSTGRRDAAEDVCLTAQRMRDHETVSGVVDRREQSPLMDRNLTAEWHLREVGDGMALSELSERIFLGKTPPRSQYEEKEAHGVLRVLKVGDLTGHGVNWSDKDRSYAKYARAPADRLLKSGDIVLTAAAHHPKYIAAKVDLVDVLPKGWEDRCVPSGEVLVIRPRPVALDPRVLLLWLRSIDGRGALQACVTGQTAHLHPDYVAEVRVPEGLTTADMSVATTLLSQSLEARRNFEELEARATRQFEELLTAASHAPRRAA
jgi:type I restriction enzyme M protein